MTETQRLRKELEKCRARNVAMFDVVEAARRVAKHRIGPAKKGYGLSTQLKEIQSLVRAALQAYDKAIEKEG